MNTPVAEVKAATASEVSRLKSDLEVAKADAELAWKAHKWFLLAGFIVGVLVGAWLAHTL